MTDIQIIHRQGVSIQCSRCNTISKVKSLSGHWICESCGNTEVISASRQVFLKMLHEFPGKEFPHQNNMGWVYFVSGNTDGIKIGWSSNVAIKRRFLIHFSKYRGESTFRIFGVIRGTLTTEAEIHEKFKHLRVPRREANGNTELFLNKNNEILSWLLQNATESELDSFIAIFNSASRSL